MSDKLAHRLRSSRERLNVSQLDVSKALHINNKSISTYECGTASPDIHTLKRLAAYYNVSLPWLLDIDSYSKQHVYSDIIVRIEALDKHDIESLREYLDFLEFRKDK